MLSAAGVRHRRRRHGDRCALRRRSASPRPPRAGQPPLVLSDDVPAGSIRSRSSASVYRTHSWLARAADVARPREPGSSQATRAAARSRPQAVAARERRAQFSLTAPFAAPRCRPRAGRARRRGGCCSPAAVRSRRWRCSSCSAAGGLRRDQRPEVRAVARRPGRRTSQCTDVRARGGGAGFAGSRCLLGAGLAVAAAARCWQRRPAVPAGGVLAHSLITPVGAAALAGGLGLRDDARRRRYCSPAGGRVADLLAVAAAASLALALSRGASGNRATAGVAGTAVLPGGGGACLPGGGRAASGAAGASLGAGRWPARLALVNLARAPAAPSLAIAFIAVSIGPRGICAGLPLDAAARDRRSGRRAGARSTRPCRRRPTSPPRCNSHR